MELRFDIRPGTLEALTALLGAYREGDTHTDADYQSLEIRIEVDPEHPLFAELRALDWRPWTITGEGNG